MVCEGKQVGNFPFRIQSNKYLRVLCHTGVPSASSCLKPLRICRADGVSLCSVSGHSEVNAVARNSMVSIRLEGSAGKSKVRNVAFMSYCLYIIKHVRCTVERKWSVFKEIRLLPDLIRSVF